MTLRGPSGRFWYIAGVDIFSNTYSVSELTPPGIARKIQEVTSPADTEPVKLPTGFERAAGMLKTSFWYEQSSGTFNTLLEALRNPDSTERVMVWGHNDADGAFFEGARVYNAKIAHELPAEDFTQIPWEAEVTGVPEQGVILHARGAETADGDSSASQHNNGTQGSAATILTSSIANPSVITTSAAHGFSTGDTVLIAGHTSVTPDINGSHTITVTSTTTFTIPVNVTADGVDGTATRTNTRDGGAGYFDYQDLDDDGGTGCLVRILDSKDGVTGVELIAFTTVADATATEGAERVAVTGVVDRYTWMDWDFTGSPGGGETITFFGGFCRNPT